MSTFTPIGKGSSAIVYRMDSLPEPKAVKRFTVDPKQVFLPSQVMRECNFHMQLTHPHLVRASTIKCDTNNHFRKTFTIDIVQELAQCNLAAFVSTYKPSMSYRLELAFKMIEQLSCLLEYLHRHWIVMRDLKNDNILLFFVNNNGDNEHIPKIEDITFKISDLGLTSMQTHYPDGTPKTSPLTSNLFSAPEMSCPTTNKGGWSYSNKYGVQIDVWALGCCVCELLGSLVTPNEEDPRYMYMMRRKKEATFEDRFRDPRWLPMLFYMSQIESFKSGCREPQEKTSPKTLWALQKINETSTEKEIHGKLDENHRKTFDTLNSLLSGMFQEDPTKRITSLLLSGTRKNKIGTHNEIKWDNMIGEPKTFESSFHANRRKVTEILEKHKHQSESEDLKKKQSWMRVEERTLQLTEYLYFVLEPTSEFNVTTLAACYFLAITFYQSVDWTFDRFKNHTSSAFGKLKKKEFIVALYTIWMDRLSFRVNRMRPIATVVLPTQVEVASTQVASKTNLIFPNTH